MFLKPEDRAYLSKYASPVTEALGDVTWPPARYDRADDDVEFVEKLVALLKPCAESSAKDMRYLGFVIAPGEDVPGEAAALDASVSARLDEARELLDEFNTVMEEVGEEPMDLDIDADDEADFDDDDGDFEEDSDVSIIADTSKVMLGMEAAEIAREISRKGEAWWTEWWEQEEYEARLATGELMARELQSVEHWNLELEDGWGIAYYQGVSATGATVGVLAARYDAD